MSDQTWDWVYFGVFAICLLIGLGTRLWNMPARKSPRVEVGDRVYLKPNHATGVHRVVAECRATGSVSGRAILVQRVCRGQDVGRPAWCFESDVEHAP